MELLDNGVDPNTKSPAGNVPLITAIVFKNDEACQILIDYGANVNLPNTRGELPIFHAIYHGNPKIVSILIECGSEIIYNGKSSLHLAAKEKQAECFRIVLETGIDKNLSDSKGVRVIEIIRDYEDPTLELIYNCKSKPPSVSSQSFSKFIFKHFVNEQIEELRDVMSMSPARIPDQLECFLEQIMVAERCLQLTKKFYTQRIESLEKHMMNLEKPTQKDIDRDLLKFSSQIRNSFIKRIEETTLIQESYEDRFCSPEILSKFSDWKNSMKEMQEFIDTTLEKGVSLFGLKDSTIESIEKRENDIEQTGKLLELANVKTEPFQNEIIEFTISTLKKIKTLKYPNVTQIEKLIKILFKQIEKSNPEAIQRFHKKG